MTWNEQTKTKIKPDQDYVHKARDKCVMHNNDKDFFGFKIILFIIYMLLSCYAWI